MRVFGYGAAMAAAVALALSTSPALAKDWPVSEHDTVFRDFAFGTGETLPELKIHYTTLGTPHRNAKGEIDNAIMVLHGTGGSGKQFLQPQFADELYGPGQPFDISRWYIILPDNIGHGASSKPSDGLRMKFPAYDYDDMVRAQHKLVTETLGIKQLRLILGTSMGCMHGFVWGENYAANVASLAPFACNPVEIAGQNRMWRKMSVDALKADPAWNGGNYSAQPMAGMRTAAILNAIAGANPIALQAQYPTRAAAEEALAKSLPARMGGDANDKIYQLESSRNYNPEPKLDSVTMPVLWINSADDFINPPSNDFGPKLVKRMPNARFILIAATPETKGHGTHTWAKFWKADLQKFMDQKVPAGAKTP